MLDDLHIQSNTALTTIEDGAFGSLVQVSSLIVADNPSLIVVEATVFAALVTISDSFDLQVDPGFEGFCASTYAQIEMPAFCS